MTEYIDRKALLEAMMRKKSGLASRRYVEGWNDCLMRVRSMVSTAPSADVAPVVRCRECKYCKESDLLAPNKFCYRLRHPIGDRQIGYNFSPDDFCSYGERKDGGAE